MDSSPLNWPCGYQAAVTLSFDDGFAATCQLTSILLRERGLLGTYHIIAGMAGETLDGLPLAGWPAVREINHLGHEIASHGFQHRPLSGPGSDMRRIFIGALGTHDRRAYLRLLWARMKVLTNYRSDTREGGNTRKLPDLEIELTSRQLLETMLKGRRVVSFSYPKGRHSPVVHRAAAQAGYHSARTIDPGINYPGVNLYALRGVALGPGLTFEDTSAWIDRAIKTHGWLILVFHLVDQSNPTSYPYHYPLTDFEKLTDRLGSLPIWVAGQGQVVKHWKRARAEESLTR